ncbi:Uncharacterised protein [Bordetella pertussis]|nr:Uncharacterised protein [Bordetella pertussis]
MLICWRSLNVRAHGPPASARRRSSPRRLSSALDSARAMLERSAAFTAALAAPDRAWPARCKLQTCVFGSSARL